MRLIVRQGIQQLRLAIVAQSVKEVKTGSQATPTFRTQVLSRNRARTITRTRGGRRSSKSSTERSRSRATSGGRRCSGVCRCCASVNQCRWLYCRCCCCCWRCCCRCCCCCLSCEAFLSLLHARRRRRNENRNRSRHRRCARQRWSWCWRCALRNRPYRRWRRRGDLLWRRPCRERRWKWRGSSRRGLRGCECLCLCRVARTTASGSMVSLLGSSALRVVKSHN